MEFVNKEYLLLLLLLIPYIIWYLLYRKKSEPTMQMSDTFAYRYAPKSLRQRLVWLAAYGDLRADRPRAGPSADSR